MRTPSVSLIVPMYNESARIALPLREMAEFLEHQPYSSELILVDDGSTDDTVRVAAEVAESLGQPIRLIRYEENRGKGYALKVGFDAARGQRLVFSDCDLSTPIAELPRFLSALERAEIAIGTRRAEGAKVVRHQPWLRENLGRVFTFIVRVTIAPVSDATCGFKAFRRDVGKELFSRSRIDDWSFDAELLLNARQRGYRWVEVPVQWLDQEGTKVKLLRDILVTLWGIVKIRANHFAGHYEHVVSVGPVVEQAWGRVAQASGEAGGDSEV
ncbi:MAG: glycosyltransferase family 2 protein [bacterium]|nr:glycosyltransferase family 2 protein [bacterium]